MRFRTTLLPVLASALAVALVGGGAAPATAASPVGAAPGALPC